MWLVHECTPAFNNARVLQVGVNRTLPGEKPVVPTMPPLCLPGSLALPVEALGQYCWFDMAVSRGSDPEGNQFDFSLHTQASDRLIPGTRHRWIIMLSPVSEFQVGQKHWYLLLEIRDMCESGGGEWFQLSKPPRPLHLIRGENGLCGSLSSDSRPWCPCSQIHTGWQKEATSEGVMLGHGYLMAPNYATNPLSPEESHHLHTGSGGEESPVNWV